MDSYESVIGDGTERAFSLRRGLLTRGRSWKRSSPPGCVWVAAATFEGREVIRACVTHGETTPDDVIELVNALDAAR